MSSPLEPGPPPPPTASALSFRKLFPLPQWVLVAALLILLAVIAAVWIDSRNRDRELRQDLARRLAANESMQQESRGTLTQTQDGVRDAQSKITLLESRLAESQSQQAALEALYRDLAPSRDEVLLTEVEQVLVIASQQLQFAGNIQAALAALQLADSKLQRLDRPELLPLRRALARDMDRLKAIPYVDVASMTARLDRAITEVDTLPLAADERLAPVPPAIPPGSESRWRQFLRDVWSDLKDLVRIEVSDRPAAALLPPSQQYFVRENLKLRLLSARLSLALRDQGGFRADLAACDALLRKYFDMRTKSVQSVLATVKQMSAAEMAAETPDLSRSLEALRVLRLSRDKDTRADVPARVSR